MEKDTRTVSDRRLGSSWSQWDGDIAGHESALKEGPALFGVLLWTALCVASGVYGALVWAADRWLLPASVPSWWLLAPLALPWGVFLISMAVVAAPNKALAFPFLSGVLSAAVPWLGRLYGPF